jgi:acetamidase/formamidase
VLKSETTIVSQFPFISVGRRWTTILLGSDDIKNVDLTKIHNLSGPIAVEGAEPGDCLVVDILDSKFDYGPNVWKNNLC